MKCTDIAELSPLHLSGELDAGRAAAFEEHLNGCSACAREVKFAAESDVALRQAIVSEGVETTKLDRKVRAGISSESYKPSRLRWIAMAAGAAIVLALAGIGVRALVAPHPAGLYADAAEDHRTEVIKNSPRRWVSDRPGIEALAARAQVSSATLAGLAPASYHLERGKLCRLDGRIFLHLVYSDGARETSVFVRPRDEKPSIASAKESFMSFLNDETVAAVKTDRTIAVFVTAGHTQSPSEMARFATQSL